MARASVSLQMRGSEVTLKRPELATSPAAAPNINKQGTTVPKTKGCISTSPTQYSHAFKVVIHYFPQSQHLHVTPSCAPGQPLSIHR